MVTILTDADIRARLRPGDAVAWMREAVLAAHAGRLHTPPRVSTELGGGRLVFTTGALEGEWYGYRSYDSFDTDPGQQVVVLHDWGSGEVRGIAVGNELGPRRVGAIGGVAFDALADPTATTLALIGTGTQAFTQLWAIGAVRRLSSVRVFGRDRERRIAFARRASGDLGLPVTAVESARDAVEGADVVVLATNSPVPVIEPAWVKDGAFVTTLGPKQVGRAEFGAELVDRADLVVTDSVAQTAAYDPPFVLAGTPQQERLMSLGAAIADNVTGRTVLFCSVGLAGTEAYLLAKLLS
ncbi:ornithine cyclodeaminase family protein [Kribbella jiaozuonensis]|uniref:Ornithine cyclodeaminase family protein n=1 Tax=Kribbella jiaozuonensis TaxID=2575441 RepID=A0A4U3LGA8_9ACTN|nr:NAD(P)-binding domain-containing protein [Kribbella jiaozuonensis]TKK74588.1 ornithine cyclodeaminase family protein [Kribbella jiaozuonensis]